MSTTAMPLTPTCGGPVAAGFVPQKLCWFGCMPPGCRWPLRQAEPRDFHQIDRRASSFRRWADPSACFRPLVRRNPAAVARQNSIEQIAANQFRPRRPERPRAQPKRKSFSLQHSLLDLGESSVTSAVRAGRPLNIADRSRTTSTGQAKRGRYCAERPQLPQGQSRSEKTGQKRSDQLRQADGPAAHHSHHEQPTQACQGETRRLGHRDGCEFDPLYRCRGRRRVQRGGRSQIDGLVKPGRIDKLQNTVSSGGPAPVLTNRSASTPPRKKTALAGGSEGRWLK